MKAWIIEKVKRYREIRDLTLFLIYKRKFNEDMKSFLKMIFALEKRDHRACQEPPRVQAEGVRRQWSSAAGPR
ncbi:MAG: hypothetical protein DRJ26_05195 [Candidatus Methanomethylicota archaeon]|uniref:Uncharacterized protein n=1 Tax=Thermoproteota archaeon TaxID=2056631 RepID=A0A497EXP6_9CREN|nr:MAG: hypothetical protein DRJ26_05195 [Candidatus Verstraetearchaeota archaeon]